MSETDDRDWYASHFLEEQGGDLYAAFLRSCGVVAHHEDVIARLHVEGHTARQHQSAGYMRRGRPADRAPRPVVTPLDVSREQAPHA